jgi:ribonuclease P protein subunit POP4
LFSKLLIGNEVVVLDSSVPTLIQKSGRIIDETKNILKVASKDQKTISIPKSTCVFELEIGGRKIVVSGRELIGTPQERIHKL